MPRTSVSPQTVGDTYRFFAENLTEEQLDLAESRGYLFGYDYDLASLAKRDPKPLKQWHSLLLGHMDEVEDGLFKKTIIGKALIKLQKITHRKFTSGLSIRLQSANYLRFYSDIRNIKASSTSGLRLLPHVKQLCEKMNTKGD